MTPQQVSAAAPAAIGPYSDPSLDDETKVSRLVTTHHGGGFDFSVALLFSRASQGLSQVRMLLSQGESCAALEGEVSKRYGRPEQRAPYGFARWRDAAGGNIITLQPLDGCWLVYEPLPKPGDSGL